MGVNEAAVHGSGCHGESVLEYCQATEQCIVPSITRLIGEDSRGKYLGKTVAHMDMLTKKFKLGLNLHKHKFRVCKSMHHHTFN
jgi:hypothetical protein